MAAYRWVALFDFFGGVCGIRCVSLLYPVTARRKFGTPEHKGENNAETFKVL